VTLKSTKLFITWRTFSRRMSLEFYGLGNVPVHWSRTQAAGFRPRVAEYPESMNAVALARFLMTRFEAAPISPDIDIGRLQEVFRHPSFLDASADERRRIMLRSSESSYRDELEYPLDNYFGTDLSRFVGGAAALDLGCFNGGRSVAWSKRYRFAHLSGVDVAHVYVDAATQFAEVKNVAADFLVGRGESLPFTDERFDAVLSFDVFEHVQDVEATLGECHRVLKRGGKLCVAFPGYWHPREHHLGLATKLPGIHYLFSGETLVRAYYRILEERGSEALWYRRLSPELQPWERGNTINGTTLSQFRKLIKNMNWRVLRESKRPIGSVGRLTAQSKLLKRASSLLLPLVYLPGVREAALHRIVYILERR
jgi:SAM-dependent methyltransferase